MRSKLMLAIAATGLALAAPAGGFAQSQAEKTGRGGVAAGQDELGGMPITVIAVVGLAAVAAGVAIASASSDHHNTTSVATVTSTTTR
jgi:hypothetical protein